MKSDFPFVLSWTLDVGIMQWENGWGGFCLFVFFSQYFGIQCACPFAKVDYIGQCICNNTAMTG